MNTPTVTQLDRDLDDGVLDLPAKDRQALRKLDSERPTMATETAAATTTDASKKKPARKPPSRKPAKKSASPRAAKTTTTASYTSDTPKGLWPVGTMVTYLGGSTLKNDWLKKGAVGRVYGYRPGKTGGGLYAVRFEQGATLLSTKRVAKVAKGTQS
jgi:hypothetical protein